MRIHALSYVSTCLGAALVNAGCILCVGVHVLNIQNLVACHACGGCLPLYRGGDLPRVIVILVYFSALRFIGELRHLAMVGSARSYSFVRFLVSVLQDCRAICLGFRYESFFAA